MTNELLFWVDATKNESVTGGEQSVLTKVNLVTEGGKCLKKTTFFKKDRLRRAIKTPPGQLAIYVDKMNAEKSAILFSKRTVVKQQNTGWGGVRTTPESSAPTGNGLFTKQWAGHSVGDESGVGEILCSAILDHVIRVKRIPPFVPKFHDYTVRIDNREIHCYKLVIECLGSMTLRRFIEDQKDSPTALFKRQMDGVFTQILVALYLLQKHAGFVHNDFHPDNIILQPRGAGSGDFVVEFDKGIYVFDESIPFVKIIDFGHSFLEHPLTGEQVSAVWTSPISAYNNSADIMRMAMELLAYTVAERKTGGFFSDELWTNLDLASGRIEGNFKVNVNSIHFPFPMECETPGSLIEGTVARKFKQETYRCLLCNIFFELEHDMWNITDCTKRYERREERTPKSYEPIHVSFIRADFAPQSFKMLAGDLVRVLKYRLSNVGARTPPPMTYAGVGLKIQRRFLWRSLVLFQRSVIFYLRIFFYVDRQPEGVPVHREGLKLAMDIIETIKTCLGEDCTAEKVMRCAQYLCVQTACGGFPHFFKLDSLKRLENYDKCNVAEMEKTALKKMYEKLRSLGLINAPAEFTSVEKVHEMDLECIYSLFEWTSSTLYFGLSLKEATRWS